MMGDCGMSLAAFLVGAQIVFYVFGWLIFATVVREERLPILHWSAFLLCLGVGFWAMSVSSTNTTSWSTLLSTTMFMVSFPIVFRGIELFLRIKPRDEEHMLWLGAMLLAVLVCALFDDMRHRIGLSLLSEGLVTLRGVSLNHVAFRAQYGRVIMGWPALLAAIG